MLLKIFKKYFIKQISINLNNDKLYKKNFKNV